MTLAATEVERPSSHARDRRGSPAAILAIILISYFMILLDNSVIFTGLPSIRTGLDLTPTGLSWVQDAYTLVFGGLLLLGARAGDIVGRRRLFTIGLAIFGTASLLIGLSPSGSWMIAGRALQGVGAAIVAPSSLALITAYFEGEQRSRAVAWYAATAGIGASLGLLVGGALTDLVSWRAAFLVNVPIAAAMIVGARAVLEETPRRRGRLDAAGALLATFGMGALVYGIIESTERGWSSAAVVGSLAVGVVLLATLVANEARAEQPIMPLRLFRSRERSGAYAVRMLYLGAMIGFFYFTTQLMQDALGFTPLQAGMGFLPMSLANFAVALAIPRLGARISNAALLIGGIALTLVGMVWLSRAGVGEAYVVSMALPMILIGTGQGLAFAPLTNAGLSGVAPADAGAASGLVNTAHQLGMALGLGILVSVAAHAGTDLDGAAAVAEHVQAALTGSSALLALALVVTASVILPRRTLIRGLLTVAGSGALLAAEACSSSSSPDSSTSTEPLGGDDETDRTAKKPLLVYFSRAGENYYYGDRIDLKVGNTAVVAEMIADLVDIDVYEIRAADPYPDDYDATVERNSREQQADARPAIAGELPELVRYDTVLLGSGVWNVRAPMIMRTFVESFDFSGRTVLPFVTYAVSGMGQVADDYADACAGASIREGLAVQGEEARQARPEVEAWLRRTGLVA